MLRIRRGVLRVVNSGCSNISVGLLRIPIYGKSFMYVEPRCSTFNGFSHFHTTSIISAGDKGNGSSHSKSNPPQMIRPSAKNSLDIAASVRSAVVLARNAVLAVPGLLKSFGEMAFRAAMNPKATWASIKEEIHHYWLGTKLLWEDVKTASQILQRVVVGHGITRRERLQLVRTTTDIFRLVPFSIFIIVPFMELLLPFALRLFPNMLPSTFQDSLRKEESLKKELQVRLEVAKFMQETLQEMAEKKSSSIDRQNSGAKEIIEFIEKARLGEPVPNDTVVRMARLFKDELTLANVARPQLVSMCQYMGLPPYGADAFLRFQLRTKLRSIQEDDRRILWEGIDSLNTLELREACRERGMRSIGATQFRLKKQLQEWLELSTLKHVPISLLIMSRALMLRSGVDGPEQGIKSSLSSLDSDTINEVVLASASAEEKDTVEMRRRKLESLQFQNELIDTEREARIASSVSAEQIADNNNAAAGPSADTQRSGTEAAGAASSDKVDERSHESKGVSISVADLSDTADPKDTHAIVTAENIEKKSPEDEKKNFTISELVVLTDLARANALQREITELAFLEAYIESLPIPNEDHSSDTSSSVTPGSTIGETIHKHNDLDVTIGATGAQIEDKAMTSVVSLDQAENETAPKLDTKVDKSVLRMKSAMASMLTKLKVKINNTEKVFGDRLKLLDIDRDGEVTADEVKRAMVQVLKRNADTERSVEDLFQLVDSNKDGKVSISELLQFIQRKREEIEVEALQAQMRAVAAPKDLDTDPSSSVKNDAAETSHIEQEQSKKSARLK